MNDIGLRVRHARLTKCLTQQALADLAGVTIHYVRNLEQGLRGSRASAQYLQRIAAALGVTPEYLTGESDQSTPDRAAVAIMGVIQAGVGDSSPETVAGEEIQLRDLFPPNTAFLRVRGPSMQGLGIYDGDLVLIEPLTDPAAFGDKAIAAVKVDGEYTLKLLQRGPTGEWLVMSCYPEEGLKPLKISESVELIGRVIQTLGKRTAPSAGGLKAREKRPTPK